MKNRPMMAIWSLTSIFLLLSSFFFFYTVHAQGVAMRKDSFIDICYIEFNAETYVPLTKESIRHHSYCYKVSSSSNAATALIGLLNSAKPLSNGLKKFDKYKVRLMLSEPTEQEPYFVDQNGVVSRGKSIAKLSAWQKDAVQIILNSSYKKSKIKSHRK